MKLIEDWRQSHKLWTQRINAAGVVIMGAATALGNSWTAIPPDLRGLLPHPQTIALALFVANLVARVLSQGEPDA